MRLIKALSVRSLNERLTIFIALLAALPNLPVLALRVVQQNWTFVVIDAVVILGCLLIAHSVYKQRRIVFMQFCLCTLASIALVLTIIYGGVNQLFWFFPVVLAFFFLLKPKAALLFAGSINLAVYPILNEVDIAVVATFYTAMFSTIVFSFFCAKELRIQHADLSTMATEDFLTKTGNRRAFQHDAMQSLDSFTRHKIPVCLILLDMDHFKQLNDNYGHTVGDEVLKSASKLIKQRLRRSDRLYRIGGEEFAILLNHCSLKEAVAVTHDIKAYVNKKKDEKLPDFTLSIGLSQLQLGETLDDFIVRTDKALYKSKDNGRDMITTAH